MSAPRVSVIVCAYNAEQTIGEALDSLFAQTSVDFEVVVIDDGSTDSTAAQVARRAAGSVMPVRVVPIPHQGLAGGRNHGVAEGTGEFFAFVDADDTVEPTFVEHLLACADATGADLVVCDMQYVDFETGAPLHVCHEGDPALFGGPLAERPGLLGALGGSACDKMMHRSLFERSGITAGSSRTCGPSTGCAARLASSRRSTSRCTATGWGARGRS